MSREELSSDTRNCPVHKKEMSKHSRKKKQIWIKRSSGSKVKKQLSTAYINNAFSLLLFTYYSPYIEIIDSKGNATFRSKTIQNRSYTNDIQSAMCFSLKSLLNWFPADESVCLKTIFFWSKKFLKFFYVTFGAELPRCKKSWNRKWVSIKKFQNLFWTSLFWN